MNRIKKFYRSQLWRGDGTAHSPFMLFFVIQNFILAAMFAFSGFFTIPAIDSLLLFKGLESLLPFAVVAPAWGGILLALLIAHTIRMYTQNHEWGHKIGAAAFILWVYGTVVYIFASSWWAVFAICAPQLFFWGWYAISARLYAQQVDDGEAPLLD